MINRTVRNYQIVETLGSGGMGVVYRAVDEMVNRNVAIKVLRVDQSAAVERFRTEARAMAKLNHPNIATLYTFFAEGEEFFMVMEYVAGRNLAQVLQMRGGLGWREACDIVLSVLAGMKHAHAQGVIHRDLKPANIMMGQDGSVKITDFGIARMYQGPRLTAERGAIGTLEYLAPERLKGEDATASSDLYSIGVVMYEALVGRAPFTGENEYQLIQAQVDAAPVPPSQLNVNLPAPVEKVLLGALAKQPEARPADAAAFIAQLQEAIATRPVLAAKETVVVQIPKPAAETTVIPIVSAQAPPSGIPKMAIWGGGGAVALAAILYFAFGRPAPPPKPEPPFVEVKPAPAPAPAPAPVPVQPVAVEPVKPVPVKPAPVAPTPAPTIAETAPGPSTLADVREVFVVPSANGFDALVSAEIKDKLKGEITIAAARGTAETQLSFVFRDEKGTAIRNGSGDLEDLKGTITATATLRNPRSKMTLWTAEVNDKRGLVGGFGSKLRRMASRLAERMRDDRRR